MQLDHTLRNLSAASIRLVSGERQRFIRLAAKLDALSPLKVLSRGFAVAKKEDRLIRSVKQLSPGDRIELRFSDGQVYADIREVNYGE